MAAWRFIKYLIPIAAFLIIFLIIWGPDKLWAKTTGAFESTVEFVQENVQIGSDEIPAQEVQIPIQLKEAYDSLAASLKKGENSIQDRCLLVYKDFGEFEDFIITLDYVQEKTLLNLRTSKGVVITEFKKEFEHLKPCIIAGAAGSVSNPAAAETFFYNWVKPRIYPYINNFATPEYNWFERGLIINEDQKLIAAGKEYDLDDENLNYFNEPVSLLYKAHDDAVCFIVTHDGDSTCEDEADESGVDDDCMKEFLSGRFTIPRCE